MKINSKSSFIESQSGRVGLVLSVGNFVLLLALIIGFSRIGGKVDELAELVGNKFGIYNSLGFRI